MPKKPSPWGTPPGRRLFSETVKRYSYFRALPQSGRTASQPPVRERRDGGNRQPLPPLIRPLRGHLPPGEGESQTGRQPSAKSNRTPPPSHASVAHLPLHAGRQRSAGRIYEITGSGVSPLPVVFYLLSRLYSLSFGSVTVMVVPLPRVESTWMVPRWIITACLTMDNPRPVPPTALDRLLSTR